MKMTVDINPIKEFEAEVDCIKNPLHQEIFLKTLQFIPTYFYISPASTSGKYHPRADLGIAGTLRHTKAVFWLSEELLTHRLYAPFDDVTKDDIRVAILIHDSVKLGITENQEHTVPDHPLLVRETLRPWKNDTTVSDDMVRAWGRICTLVETHMGIWTKDKEGNEILQEPSTNPQRFVHMCDFIASRRIVEIDITQRISVTPKADVVKSDWRFLTAKSDQVKFIQSLYIKCLNTNTLYYPVPLIDLQGAIIISRGDASDVIKELKKKLGME